MIAASNRDLRQEIKKGAFRPDLYHRLSVFTLGVPPLRELGDDKLLLLEHFRRFYAEQSGVQPFSLDEAAERRWLAYAFPGNVRELRNIVIRLTDQARGPPAVDGGPRAGIRRRIRRPCPRTRPAKAT